MAFLLKVSRSGYYRYEKQSGKPENHSFHEKVKNLFYKHKKRYGSPRLHQELLKDFPCSLYQVALSLKKQKLQAVGKRKKPRTTQSTKGNRPDLLTQNFQASAPGEK